MADIFSGILDIFGGGGGGVQQPKILSTQDAFAQAYGTLQAGLPAVAAYEQAAQPIYTGLQLSNQGQIYGPAANQLQQGTYQSILDRLNTRGAFSPETNAQVTSDLLQRFGPSGIGTTEAGGRGIIYQRALEMERQAREDENRAFQAVQALPSSHYSYQPQPTISPTGIFGDIRGVQAAEQEGIAREQAQKEQERSDTFKKLLSIGGAVAGGFFGSAGGPLGTIAGASAGAGLGSAVGGMFGGSSGQTGGNPFGSILSGLGVGGGVGGPQFGIGARSGFSPQQNPSFQAPTWGAQSPSYSLSPVDVSYNNR